MGDTTISHEGFALLIMALRVDLPLPNYVADAQLSSLLGDLVDHQYLVSKEDQYLYLADDGRARLVEYFEDAFVDNVHLNHPDLGFFIDNIYIRCGKYGKNETFQMFHALLSRFSSLKKEVNNAMCIQARERGGKRPWNTLAELKDLGYYDLSKKKCRNVDWRYLWREERTPKTLVRRYKGVRK